MHPDWLGSPQHVLGGLALSAAVVLLARRRGIDSRLTAILAIAVTMAVASVLEIGEYPVLYGASADATAYYDTIADVASTLVGAVVGALGALVVSGRG